MLRIGLTGGIGTGKSTVLDRFAARGVPTLDADRLAREVVRPGTAGAREIAQHFGSEYFTPTGELDRQRLGQLVFGDEDARRRLEGIIHPRVHAAIDAWVRELEAAGHAGLAVVDIPLLFETGRADSFDRVVVVACEVETQIRRVVKRDGLSEEDVRRRIAAQWPIADKARRAHHVIRTDGSLEDTYRQVDALIDELSRFAR